MANPTPLATFSNSNITSNPKYWHQFGCPAYVLVEPLQGENHIFQKWKARVRVEVYLGRSAQHAKNVALVLSLETGFVSPQFHVKLDSSLQTLRDMGSQIPRSQWLFKAGFVHKKVGFASSDAETLILEFQRTLDTPESTPASQPHPQADNESAPKEAQDSEGEQLQEEFPPLHH
jgi:hypothetical protein